MTGSERIAVPVSGNLSANESQVLLAAAIEGAGIAMQPPIRPTADRARSAGGAAARLRAAGLGVYGSTLRRQMPVSLRALLDFLAARFADPGTGRRANLVLRPDCPVERAHEIRLRDDPVSRRSPR